MRDKSKINRQSSKSTSSKKRRNKRDIISTPPYSEFPATTSTFSGLAILFSLFLGFLGVSNTYASSISISLTGNVNLNILKDNTNPTFGKSTTQTATVTSDHFTGYTLTIAGSNDTGRLVGSNDSTKYLSSITTPLTESQFNTDAHNDQWGFLPSSLYNASTSTTINNTDYQPSPIHTTPTTMDITNSPTDNDGNDYTLALASRISPNIPLDSYGQTFVLAATGNGYDYYLGYTDDQQNLPANTYGNTQSSTINISSTTPTKDGWVFKGWCDVATTNNGTTCSGTTYQPGDSIDLSSTASNNINLHAIWAKGYDNFADAFEAAGKTKPEGSSYYAMQDITPEICASIVVGSPTTDENTIKNTLVDTRGGSYLVAKYADGHCWMRQNLNISLSASSATIAYDYSSGETFNYYPKNSTQSSTGTIWEQDAKDGARSFAGGDTNYIGGTDISVAGTITTSGKRYELIGSLYNWAAATAQDGEHAAVATGEVTTSICPKGWRLPANEGEYSFSNLMGAYGLPTTNQSQGYSGQLQNPLNFNRPGYYNWSSGALGLRGTRGHFWSSVGYSSAYAYTLDFDSAGFYPHYGHDKGYGFSVRCVAV